MNMEMDIRQMQINKEGTGDAPSTTNVIKRCNVRIKRSYKTKRNRGGQPNNKNAVGHGAPKGNKNAVGYGAPYANKNAVKSGKYRRHRQLIFPCDTPINRQVEQYIKANNLDDRTIEVFNAVKKMLKKLKS